MKSWVQEACENLMSVGAGPHSGTILNVSDRYGFIKCSKTFQVFEQDVLIPPDEINSRENYDKLHVGAEVQFHIMLSNMGDPQATQVKVISHKEVKADDLENFGNEDKPKCCTAWYRG